MSETPEISVNFEVHGTPKEVVYAWFNYDMGVPETEEVKLDAFDDEGKVGSLELAIKIAKALKKKHVEDILKI